jgi:hypothetical protein
VLRGPDVYRSGAYEFFLRGIICRLPSSKQVRARRSAAGMASTGETLALKWGLGQRELIWQRRILSIWQRVGSDYVDILYKRDRPIP